eukprot:RCo048944
MLGQDDNGNPQLIEQFKTKVSDVLPLKDNLKFSDEDVLRRFLGARNGNLELAEKMFRSYLGWRADNNVENVLTESFPEDVAAAVYGGFCGDDKDGYPIFYTRYSANVDPVLKKYSEDQLIRFHIYVNERCREKMKCANRKRMSFILDLAEVGLGLITNSKVSSLLKKSMSMDQDRYPEQTRRIYVINSPMGFPTLFAAFKSMLDAKVQQKLHILGKSFMKDVSEYIDPSQLPAEIGGSGGPLKVLKGDPNSYVPPCRLNAPSPVSPAVSAGSAASFHTAEDGANASDAEEPAPAA